MESGELVTEREKRRKTIEVCVFKVCCDVNNGHIPAFMGKKGRALIGFFL